MGMDVSGKNPTKDVGKYFRSNVWWWRPLAFFCDFAAPVLWGKIEYSQSNDGDGLNAKDSVALAVILKEHLASGSAKSYIEIREAELKALPLEACTLCDSTGTRNDEVLQGKCNGCDGTGYRKAWDTIYPLNETSIQEFAEFVEHSGGFEIW
jgi:hypothetical protein